MPATVACPAHSDRHTVNDTRCQDTEEGLHYNFDSPPLFSLMKGRGASLEPGLHGLLFKGELLQDQEEAGWKEEGRKAAPTSPCSQSH